MSLEVAREARPADKTSNPRGLVAIRWEGDDVVYRLVRSDPPHVRDLTSKGLRGLPPPTPASSFLLHIGISVFDEERLARARAYPPTFLAELHLREGLGFFVANTLSDGHFTVWGEPSALLAVTRVIDRVL